MDFPRNLMLCVATMALLAACNKPAPEAQIAPTAATPAVTGPEPTATAPAPASGNGLLSKDGKPVPVLPFDLESIALSQQPLGEFPFFALPSGYAPRNTAHSRAYARFPFRLGDGVHWVEGRTWSAQLGADQRANPDQRFSAPELQRNLRQLIEAAGGEQVFEGPLLRDIYYGPQLEDEIGGGFIDAVNLDQNVATSVHVIRQAGRTLWVQLAVDSHAAGLVVVEQLPFTATAAWSPEFPHLTLPQGYELRNRPAQRDSDRFPFWVGDRFEWVEGRSYSASFDHQQPSQYSQHEVRRNLQAMVEQAGGVLVFDGAIPKAQADTIGKDLQSAYSEGAGYAWEDAPVQVYRVDQADGKQLWIHARPEYLSSGWVVVERDASTQSAAPLPAAAQN